MTVAESKLELPTPQIRTRYDSVAMTLHWLIAAAVLTNIALGLYMGDLPRSDPMKFAIIQLHKSIGLTVLVLTLMRIAWRLMHPFLPLPEDMPRALKFLARTTHILLYTLLLALPLTGWMIVSSSPLGLPTSYFGLFDWPHLWFLADMTRESKKIMVETFEDTHVFLAWIMICLVPLHIAGALYHQFVRRDSVLKRMLPFA